MFCQSCGKENPQNANFCAHCGGVLRDEPPPVEKQRLNQGKDAQTLGRRDRKRAEQQRKLVEKAAADLNRDLRGLLAVPIDYSRDLIDSEHDLWRFCTRDGRHFIKRREGSSLICSVGTVIEGTIPCTHVMKMCRGWRTSRAFFPLLVSPEYMNKFDAHKFYKQRTGWNQATVRLNTDPILARMINKISTAHESGGGRTVYSIPDERKNPLTAVVQLVPQGDMTLAALLFISLAKGEVAKCVEALGRIAALIGTLPIQELSYGLAIGWEIMHDLRGDLYRGEITDRLRLGWPLLARAHAVEAQASKSRRGA